jgi:PPOX class probable F420-dependent enzyme
MFAACRLARMEIGGEVRAFIESVRVARLATVDEHGRPHVVPVCFALAGGVLYTPIDEKPKRGGELRRIRNIHAQPHVQVLVDRYDEDWSALRYVQLRGRASVLEAGEEHTKAIALLRERYSQYREMALERLPIIAVQITRVVAWRASGD